jgi:S1-C subfamily serine protease
MLPLAQSAEQTKDVWDKLDAASGIVAGVLVAAIGAFATYVYNQRQQQATAADAEQQRAAEDARAERQLAVLRVQTIQSFFPHLKSDDRDREAALLAIDALGDHELAARMAVAFGGDAAVSALSRIAATAPDEAADRATSSLAAVLDALRASVVQVAGPNAHGTGFIVTPNGVIATTNFVVDVDTDIRVRFANDEEHPATLLYRGNRDVDVALLQIVADRLPSLRMSERPPAVGEEVVTLGFGGVGGEAVTAGVVTDVLQPSGASLGEVQARIRTEPGFAGAPLVLRNGEVVAVHVGARPNPDATKTAFAIPVVAVSRALSSLAHTGDVVES